MTRKNNQCVSFDRSKENFNDINELFLAAQLSKYTTFVLPNKDGFIMVNPQSHFRG